MDGPQTVTGTLTDGRTIVLDRAIAPAPGRVRLVVEPIEEKPRMSLWDFLDDLSRRQAARGHIPRTREEIDRDLGEERSSWGD
jgi:hypothetical protein